MTSDHAAVYKSGSQRARVVTEFWGEHNLYCPNCSSPKLTRQTHNTKVIDFCCPVCEFKYQLKGQKSRIGNSISDGAYESMMDAIRRDDTPNFYFMHYDLATWRVKNLLLIPHFAFPPSAIVKRPPLSRAARRAGWIGCNIALHRIPPDARIAIVATRRSPSPLRSGDLSRLGSGERNVGEATGPRGPSERERVSQQGRDEEALRAQREEVVISSPANVRAQFRKVKPLQEISTKQRGWTLDVLNIIHRLMDTKRRRAGALQDASPLANAPEQRASILDCTRPLPLSHRETEPNTFTNEDIYAFALELEKLHPDNRHVRDKIRQQLQVLRDAGFLEHIGHGEWRLK